MTGPSVSEVIGRWAPRSVSPEVAAFARQVVAAAASNSAGRAKALLFAAGKLGAFGVSLGLALDADVLLGPSLIERFASSRFAGTPPTARTLRTNLRFLARHARANVAPGPLALARERAKAPYSAAELAAYLALADAQPTALGPCPGGRLGRSGCWRGAHRRRAALRARHRRGVPLGRGARRRRRAPRPLVPVLAAFHERLVASADFFGERYLVSGTNPKSHNVTNPLIRSLSGGIDLPRLETPRLRSSYLVAMAEAIGLAAFMDAAGVTCSQRLGDLVAHLCAPDEAAAVALLGAQRR